MKKSCAATWPTANGLKLTPSPANAVPAQIILNGAVAHLGKKGDLLTIMNFAVVDQKKAAKWKPRVIVLGKGNKIVDERGDLEIFDLRYGDLRDHTVSPRSELVNRKSNIVNFRGSWRLRSS